MSGEVVSEPIFKSALESLASAHNCLVELVDGAVEVRAAGLDHLDHEASPRYRRVACGVTTFNWSLALAAQGCPVEVRWRPDPARPELAARLEAVARRARTVAEERLFTLLTRLPAGPVSVVPGAVLAPQRARLMEAVRIEGAWLELLSGPAAASAIAELVAAAARVLSRSGGPSEPGLGWRTGASGAEPVLGVLGTAGDLPGDHLTAGYALQRLRLTAADAGLAVAVVTEPIEVPSAREQLRLALGRFGVPQLVLQIGQLSP